MDPKTRGIGTFTWICIILSVFVVMIRGAALQEDCDLQRVHDCFVNINTTVLSVNQTAFCNHELKKLKQCLQPYDGPCQNESLYQLNAQTFEPSTFGCQGSGGLQCDLQAIRSCSSKLDTSSLFTNVSYFCNFELKTSLNCLAVYKDVCVTSSYSKMYDSLLDSLQPDKYGCSGTSGKQCELLNAIQCIIKFNFDRVEHFNSGGSPMNETALCLHRKSAESCLTPYENACGSKPTFSRMKLLLKDERCEVQATTPINTSPPFYTCDILLVWAVFWIIMT